MIPVCACVSARSVHTVPCIGQSRHHIAFIAHIGDPRTDIERSHCYIAVSHGVWIVTHTDCSMERFVQCHINMWYFALELSDYRCGRNGAL